LVLIKVVLGALYIDVGFLRAMILLVKLQIGSDVNDIASTI